MYERVIILTEIAAVTAAADLSTSCRRPFWLTIRVPLRTLCMAANFSDPGSSDTLISAIRVLAIPPFQRYAHFSDAFYVLAMRFFFPCHPCSGVLSVLPQMLHNTSPNTTQYPQSTKKMCCCW